MQMGRLYLEIEKGCEIVRTCYYVLGSLVWILVA